MSKVQMLQDLERKSMGKLLLQYSLPAVIGMAAVSAYNIIDSIYVGQWCSPFAVAALALVFPVMNLITAFGTLVGLGTAATASLVLGQHDYERAYRVMGNCITLGAIMGICVGWLPLPWLEDIMILFGAQGEALKESCRFMSIILLGFPITTSFLNLNHLMRASGYPKKAMMSLLISMVVNIIVAPLLMLWCEMGVAGAALATILAQAAGMVWVVLHYLNPVSVLHFRRDYRIYKLNGKIVRRILGVGLAPCLVNMVGCLVTVIFNHLFLRYEGDMGVGAFGAVNRSLFFFVMVSLGIAQGMQPIVGYNMGMGQFSRVRSAVKLAMIWSMVVTLIGFLLMQIFPQETLALFVKADNEHAHKLIEVGAHGMHLFALFFPLVGLQVVSFNFFQAIGQPVMSITLSLTRQLIFLLPSLMILPRYLEEDGVWLSQGIADLLAFALSFTALMVYQRRYLPRKDHVLPDLGS